MNKIKSLLKTPSEHHLFATKPYVLKHFALECSINETGDGALNSDAFVFIHEAAHFEDFQVEDAETADLKFNNLNLYTVNDEHIGNLENTENLPAIKSLIRPFLDKNKPSFLEEGSIFMNHHDGYIGAEDSMAAESLQGMSTETNGYTHGTIIQARLQPLLPDTLTFKDESGQEFVLANPLKNKITQAEGLYYFIYNFNLYLRLLKKDHPRQWKDFFTEKNKTFLRKLFDSSITTLKTIKPCDLRNSDEGLNFYITELGADNLEIMEELMGSEAIMGIVCRDPKSDLKKIIGPKPEVCEIQD
ncbi:MAG: hypothetical protein ACOVP4_04745 [Bacteriovoracaceae bacterium]